MGIRVFQSLTHRKDRVLRDYQLSLRNTHTDLARVEAVTTPPGETVETKRTQSDRQAAGRSQSQRQFSPVKRETRMATLSTWRKPARRARVGERLEVRRGSKSWHACKEASLNSGGLLTSLGRDGWLNHKESHPMGQQESDSSVVLGDGSAAHMGKGRAAWSLGQSTHAGGLLARHSAVSRSLPRMSLRDLAEEPGAGILHAGICAGVAR